MYRVYWEHPSQGKDIGVEVGYNGDGKLYRRLRYAVLFAKKLRQDPQTGHIGLTVIFKFMRTSSWATPKVCPQTG